MAWDEGKFFDNLNRAKNRLQENPHLTEIERETYLAAFAELQMYRNRYYNPTFPMCV